MVLIGIAVVAGAAFLAWMFLRRPGGTVATTAGSGPSSILSQATKPGSAASVLANSTLGIGAASFKYGIKGAELVADGALSLGKDAVDASARVLSKTVNLGGTVVVDAGKVSSSIVSTGGKVVTAGIGLPIKVVTTQLTVVKDVAGQAYSGAGTITKDLGGAASAVGSKVGNAASSVGHAIASIF